MPEVVKKSLSPTLAREIADIPTREPETPLQPQKEVVYVEVPKIVERVIEKPVERIVEVEKRVERIIEKPVIVQQPAPPPEPITEKHYIYIQPEQQKPSEEKASGDEVQPEPKTEAKPRQPEVTQSAQPELKPEEKSSKPEEKTSGTITKKLKLYNGSGRRHTTAEIDEILDGYILYGELPEYVSERQRSSYRHHVKLPERRQLLEQAGLIKTATSRTKKRTTNVVPMAGAKAHGKRRSS